MSIRLALPLAAALACVPAGKDQNIAQKIVLMTSIHDGTTYQTPDVIEAEYKRDSLSIIIRCGYIDDSRHFALDPAFREVTTRNTGGFVRFQRIGNVRVIILPADATNKVATSHIFEISDPIGHVRAKKCNILSTPVGTSASAETGISSCSSVEPFEHPFPLSIKIAELDSLCTDKFNDVRDRLKHGIYNPEQVFRRTKFFTRQLEMLGK